jgi:uncharacterized protein YndB with AHSA1/START domain
MTDSPAAPLVLDPIVKSVTVSLPVEAAFALFTERAAAWWPLATHSVFGRDAATCRLEPGVGGRFYEVHRNGQQSEWGRVTHWAPPARVVFSFYPGRGPAAATEVEVTFAPAPGGTRVTLVHRGWEKCAPAQAAERAGYEQGWADILARLQTATQHETS